MNEKIYDEKNKEIEILVPISSGARHGYIHRICRERADQADFFVAIDGR